MKPYVEPTDRSRMIEDTLSGRIKQVDGKWYWTEWHVSYGQQGVCTADNFVTYAAAFECFTRRLNDLRIAWGHKGAKFTETLTENEYGKIIRFRNVLKSGKPGKMTGSLSISHIQRPQ